MRGTNLLGVSDIARKVNLRPGTIHAWRRRHIDFPKPTMRLARGPLWEWATILKWLKKTKRV